MGLPVLPVVLVAAAAYALATGHPGPAALLAVFLPIVALVAVGDHRHPSTDHYEHATDPEDVTA